MKSLLAIVAAMLLVACGGGGDLDTSRTITAAAPPAATGCMAPADYRQLAAGFMPRPDLLPGEVWRAPFILRPVTPESSQPNVVAPGFVGRPVIVLGPQGQPMHAYGMYYVPGETPPFVCPESPPT